MNAPYVYNFEYINITERDKKRSVSNVTIFIIADARLLKRNVVAQTCSVRSVSYVSIRVVCLAGLCKLEPKNK